MKTTRVPLDPWQYRELEGFDPMQPGELWRRSLLGTEATYEIVEPPAGGLVRVRVVEAPGLPQGFELSLTIAALAEMQPVHHAA
jgi:hypothetical protein